MTVIVTKDAINLREKLSELDKETGIKGEELMRADTSAEAREALQLDQQLFTDFESTGIDDNATSTVLTVSDTGIDVTGTATMDGLTVEAGNNVITLETADSGYIKVTSTDRGGDYRLSANGSTSEYFDIQNGTQKLVRFADNGDISFYEDTGTTPKFFWDASAESLGVGTASPSSKLDVIGDIEVSGGIYIGGTAAANLLDDYEEGLWTPLLVPSTGAFTSQQIINYLTDKPRYTKIGNLVMVSVVFTTYELTKGTGTGDVYLGGLPFEVYTSSAATITTAHDFLGDNPSSGSVSYQSDEILLKYRTSSNGEDVNLQVSDLGTTDGSNTFKLTMVYRTNE